MVLPIANLFGVESWLIVAVLVLLLFGGKKIPELMRGVGQGVGELKKGMEDGQRQLQDAIRHEPAPTPPTTATNVSNPVSPTVVVAAPVVEPVTTGHSSSNGTPV